MTPHVRREPLVHAFLAPPVVHTGMLTGGLLVLVMSASLIVANRVPALESFASIRNAICYTAFGFVMAIPICRFLLLPRRLLVSAWIAWLLFTVGFAVAGFYFSNLDSSLGRTPLEIFLLGLVFYAMVAVLAWVVSMVQMATHHSLAPSHRRGRQTSNQLR